MGNGYDTLFLSTLTNNVLAFDIQKKALSITSDHLKKVGLIDHARLILDGHENVAHYVQKPVKAVIFNLGYLPGSDKKITTRANNTLNSLLVLSDLLISGGRISIMIYWGHTEGQKEKKALLDWAAQLDQKYWKVARYNIVNEAYEPPILIMLEKI